MINPKLKIKFTSLPEDDPFRRKPLIKLAKDKLDWTPKIELDKGIDLTIDYFKNL